MIFRAVLILFVFMCNSCDKKRIHKTNLNEFQKQLNASFKDATTTPLNDSDLKASGLDFQIDSNYVAKADMPIHNAKVKVCINWK